MRVLRNHSLAAVAIVIAASGCTFLLNNDQYSHGLGVPFAVDQIYWTDHFKQGFAPTGQIERAGLDGQNRTTLVTGLHDPDGLALDMVYRKMYWADSSASVIQRADLSGKNVETLVTLPPMQKPTGLVIDFPRARMYWTEFNGGTISRADYRDGSGPSVVLANLQQPNSIALALDTKAYADTRRMFWTEHGGGTIKRADFDGQNVQVLLANLKIPEALALNLTTGKMYWSESGSEIHEANLDGSGGRIIQSLNISEPYGIALDVSRGHMYWTLIQGSYISNDDPDPVKARIITNIQGSPAGIALGIK